MMRKASGGLTASIGAGTSLVAAGSFALLTLSTVVAFQGWPLAAPSTPGEVTVLSGGSGPAGALRGPASARGEWPLVDDAAPPLRLPGGPVAGGRDRASSAASPAGRDRASRAASPAVGVREADRKPHAADAPPQDPSSEPAAREVPHRSGAPVSPPRPRAPGAPSPRDGPPASPRRRPPSSRRAPAPGIVAGTTAPVTSAIRPVAPEVAKTVEGDRVLEDSRKPLPHVVDTVDGLVGSLTGPDR